MVRFTMTLSKYYKRIFSFTVTKRKVRTTLINAFGKYLLLTNTISSAGLMFIGDLFQQEIEYQRNMLPQRYDWGRVARLTVVGLGYGPIHHYFYLGIHKFWPVANIQSVTKKIIADQLIMSPVCIAFFFYVVGLLEHKSLYQCTEELQAKGLEVYTVDWCIWPPTQFINFYLLPVRYQVLYINAVTMFYNVYLSYIKHREHAQECLDNVNIHS